MPTRERVQASIDLVGRGRHVEALDSFYQTYPPTTGALADFLAALRRQLLQGGRFRVNEHGRAFTADQNIFIGNVPLASWFPPLSII